MIETLRYDDVIVSQYTDKSGRHDVLDLRDAQRAPAQELQLARGHQSPRHYQTDRPRHQYLCQFHPGTF